MPCSFRSSLFFVFHYPRVAPALLFPFFFFLMFCVLKFFMHTYSTYVYIILQYFFANCIFFVLLSSDRCAYAQHNSATPRRALVGVAEDVRPSLRARWRHVRQRPVGLERRRDGQERGLQQVNNHRGDRQVGGINAHIVCDRNRYILPQSPSSQPQSQPS